MLLERGDCDERTRQGHHDDPRGRGAEERDVRDPNRFTITVKDGIATVEGMPETASVGHDMIEEMRHVEGAVAVRDRLSYPRPQRAVPVSGPLF